MSDKLDFASLTACANPLDQQQILARFQQVAAMGGLRHALPLAYGGYGDSFRNLCQTHRLLGESSRDTGLLLMLNAHLWGAVFPILLYGGDGQKSKFLPALLDGRWLGGHAISEPGCGSDVQAMSSRAERVGDGYRLHGEKRYITNIPLANWLVVYVKLDGHITAFLVARDDNGCHFSSENAVQACRGSMTGSVHLEHCKLGPDRLLGKAGAGAQMLQRALELERAFIFAGIAGIMEGQLDRVIRHSRERVSGGTHLGRHQAIGHRIADMKLRLDTIGLWLNECSKLCDEGKRLTLASAQTKLYAAEAFLQSSLDAVQILGAAGLEESTGLVGLVEDALAGRLFSGSSEVQKNLIATLLGTGDGFKRFQ